MNALRLLAPAKLNLGLQVLGRRADGYHLLRTLYHAIDLADRLWAVRADGFALAVTADEPRDAVAAGDDNLALRAARAFAARAGLAGGFGLRLHKRIPHGAGLGGGSSDAAAVLRLCNELCGRLLSGDALHELARGLGADVPFFLRGGSQWGLGIGDELSPEEDVPSRHFLLLVPPFACETAAVYKNLDLNWNAPIRPASIPGAKDRHHEDSALRHRFANDLENAAERVRPELRELRSRVVRLAPGLLETGLHMTGSGSTLFVPAPDAATVGAVAAALAPLRGQGVRLIAARSLEGLPEPEPAPFPGGGG